MVPSDIKFYTWVDVQDALRRAPEQKEWPEELIRARTYWSGLELGIKPGTEPVIREWLGKYFDSRYKNDAIQLEIGPLSINFEELQTQDIKKPKVRPSLTLPSTIYSEMQRPRLLPIEGPKIIAFHSFKGGVGRTLHAVSFAKTLAKQGKKVLLIDGDLEAPGISYLLFSTLDPEISYSDFLALVHSDEEPEGKNAIELTANLLLSQKRDDIFVLPAFRNRRQFYHLEVKPEHLTNNSSNPYILTHVISGLGKKLGVDFIIIDLRAGLSEFSTGLVFDPRIKKVFVTSSSAQSIEGSKQLLEKMAELTPPKKTFYPWPAVIITQIPKIVLERRNEIDLVKEELKNSFFEKKEKESEDEFDVENLVFLESPFNQELVSLPIKWKDVMATIKDHNLENIVRPLIDLVIDRENFNTEKLKEARKKLAEKTKNMILAEQGEVDTFFWTKPLKMLAGDFVSKIPNVVIIGAKGAGKTLLFIELLKKIKWKDFVEEAGMESTIEACLLPVLQSQHLKDKAETITYKALDFTRQNLAISPVVVNDAYQYIKAKLRENRDQVQWKEEWLNAIAHAAGYPSAEEDDSKIGRKFITYLAKEKKRVIALFDGIEDVFQTKEEVEKHPTALRELLLDLPNWLKQQPGEPLGIIVLVRQDYVQDAIKQNLAQFKQKYEAYQLEWDPVQALRLVAYIVKDVWGNISEQEIENSLVQELVEKLEFIWGKKLGKTESREAAAANWILTALSDWNGQIQARDMVRFLHKAAQESVNNDKWTDRILAVSAIKTGVEYCSDEKVKEVKEENVVLKNIFEKIEKIPADKKYTPFTIKEWEGLQNGNQLNDEDIKALIKYGVILKDKEDRYHIAEIYRSGLGFDYAGRKMTKLLAFRKAIES